MDRFFNILMILSIAGLIFMVGVHCGRQDLRSTARAELLNYTPGSFLKIHSLGLGIDAIGRVHTYQREVNQ